MLLWLAVVLPALLLVPPHWGDLTNGIADRVLAVNNLLMIWLLFPLIKALHELGHGIAAKAGGGEVHDMGIMLLVLMPVPYVDASSVEPVPLEVRARRRRCGRHDGRAVPRGDRVLHLAARRARAWCARSASTSC